MFKEIKNFIRNFAVPGKITFRITAEHGVNFIEFCDAVVECGF